MIRPLLFLALPLLFSCNPTVQVHAPKDPIVIDLNVNIEHHIRVEIEKDIEKLIQEEGELF